jgi:hypothetical protein
MCLCTADWRLVVLDFKRYDDMEAGNIGRVPFNVVTAFNSHLIYVQYS